MRHIILMLASFAMISTLPAGATQWITNDRGGLLVDYAERFAAASDSGERVVIDGLCLSACTLAIGMLPRGQICVTPNAVLGFHAAWRPTAHGHSVRSQFATRVIYEVYPPNVRKWIDRHDGLSEQMILLEGCELAAMVPPCDDWFVAAR
jgi:hypothetical protein